MEVLRDEQLSKCKEVSHRLEKYILTLLFSYARHFSKLKVMDGSKQG